MLITPAAAVARVHRFRTPDVDPPAQSLEPTMNARTAAEEAAALAELLRELHDGPHPELKLPPGTHGIDLSIHIPRSDSELVERIAKLAAWLNAAGSSRQAEKFETQVLHLVSRINFNAGWAFGKGTPPHGIDAVTPQRADEAFSHATKVMQDLAYLPEAAAFLDGLAHFLAQGSEPAALPAKYPPAPEAKRGTAAEQERRRTKAQNERKVAKYVASQQQQGRELSDLTRDGIAEATGVPTGSVSGTRTWQEVVAPAKRHAKLPDAPARGDTVASEVETGIESGSLDAQIEAAMDAEDWDRVETLQGRMQRQQPRVRPK